MEDILTLRPQFSKWTIDSAQSAGKTVQNMNTGPVKQVLCLLRSNETPQ